MRAHHELTASGITTRAATTLTGVVRSSAARDKARPAAAGPAISTAARTPENKLTAAERRAVLDVLCSDRFVDQAPLEVYAQLLDEGIYLCSVSTMYFDPAGERAGQRTSPTGSPSCPGLSGVGGDRATAGVFMGHSPKDFVQGGAPTKLPGPVKGTYFDAYVMIDIFSRYIVAAHVQTHESGLLAAEMMTEVFAVQGVPNMVHADRGTSMTSKTVATLLADLEVTRSHSRPRVSNDNPYSPVAVQDPQVRTDVAGAIRLDPPSARGRGLVHLVVQPRTSSYGIRLHTPADVHFGLAGRKATERAAVLAQARLTHPERFGTVGIPKILDSLTDAWINKPAEMEPAEPDADQTAA